MAKVFKVMDQASAFPFAMECCPGKFKDEFEVVAIRADERVAKLTVVTLPTLLAKWGFDDVEVADAVGAEVSTVAECALANLACGRVNEIEKS